MENTKVVVMSANDVAAMRKAHKEAEAAYYQAKVGALRFAIDEMEKTNKEYTLHELTAMTGLSPMEITVQLNNSYRCNAACTAGVPFNHIRHNRRVTTRQFVEVMPNGELNPNSVLNVQKWESTYRIPSEKNYR